MSETRNLAGRPVTGEHPRYSTREHVDQRPIHEFLTVLDTLLAFPEVEAVRWEQYTPYFNDGDVCTFSANDVSIKFTGKDTGGDREDGFSEDGKSFPAGYWDTHYEKYSNRYRDHYDYRTGQTTPGEKPPSHLVPSDYKDQRFIIAGVERPDIAEAFKAVQQAVPSGRFSDAFLEVFGDPAQVTATSKGFHVEFYDHE